MKIEVGAIFEFDYPFYNQAMEVFELKDQVWLVPGCHKYEARS